MRHKYLACAAVFATTLTFGMHALQAAEVVADSTVFPAAGATEYEQSIITIPLYAGGKEPVEILKLTAFMRLERETPTRNGLGHRQLEFTIADWELYGYSEYLDSDVTFRLSDVPVQPKSLVIALTESSDYPAMIVYNAIYDIYIGQKAVAKNRPGVAFAKNVYEIPPRNISVAFSKPFALPKQDETPTGATGQTAQVRTQGVRTAARPLPTPVPREGSPIEAQPLLFEQGTCEDMAQITVGEFQQGTSISKAIRAGTYSLKK